jgi:propanediol dehydratase small subunit
MEFMSIAIVLIIAFVGSWAWLNRNGELSPLPFRSRSCQGSGWRQAFPTASKQDIREFLLMFIGAFAIREGEKPKFNPSDRIFTVYRARYPSKLMPDALELETLVKSVKNKYGVKLEEIWSEGLTLGELFAQIHNLRSSQ